MLTELLDLSTSEPVLIKANKIDTGSRSGWRSVVSLTTDPGVASSVPVRSHALVEIDHEIILRSFSSFRADLQEGLLSVCAYGTGLTPY